MCESQPAEYRVTVDKTSSRQLGIEIDYMSGRDLLIEVMGPGLMDDWNASAPPHEQVMTGDIIIEVNGVRNSATQMIDECRKNKVLKMILRRSPPKSAAAGAAMAPGRSQGAAVSEDDDALSLDGIGVDHITITF
eukprot:gnl/TRDRNA2_/TRDRNA2_191293_c0_seq1.p1 gnl/TRDRNA2_/TRDRNA2_191293_c0~~gnl/TRDRNA2_/TRDRNA2_191293_c0_seq1.p1  ORF type:complete len:135 (-),score=28.38 gnl/TRDRNA2_/TRDRNA2_191293_c0_seq1:17-421(-)